MAYSRLRSQLEMSARCQRRGYLYGAISVHNSLADLRQGGTPATAAALRCLYNGSAKTLIETINEVPGLPVRHFQRATGGGARKAASGRKLTAVAAVASVPCSSTSM